ncbi:YibE/F family protein [Caldalkalibacillus mannanilyticus]|uniref:YibE/F family protein n=1 Tax=Caldalkalibacillus mannanilyticus TaxID=1418 RepID=UPI00046ABA2A|nr:YibE/F family protein [Caldalkalibacillus mannanilyticus]
MKPFKKALALVLMVFVLLGAANASLATNSTEYEDELTEYYEKQMERPDYETIKAKVIGIPFDDTEIDKPDVEPLLDVRYQHLEIKITSGKHKGKEFTIKNTIEMISPYKLIVKKGDTILLNLTENEAGEVETLRLYEISRENSIIAIIALFMILLVVIGGMAGVKSILTLAFTALMIGFVFLPLVLRGWNPILTSIGISIIITALTLVVISGYNKKTVTAILGTVGGVIVAGSISLLVGSTARLTGLGNDDAQMLAFIPQHMQLDFKGLLFAGIIIGALGAVMDVTLSVASAMREIEEVQPKIKNKDLIRSGMNIGKDIMGSMSNTLILAYAGGAIHLMLLFSIFKMTPREIVNLDLIASEIIRAMAGSIGLICAIPLTAFLAGTVGRYYKPKEK